VKTLVNNLLALYPNTSIAITGHSLGAAMAAHCSAEFVNKGYKIKTTYSYGMPRVGNQAFEQWYVSVVPGTFRVVHRKDPVPHLPYERWGFHHMPYEVSIT
jgi:predicted lipase